MHMELCNSWRLLKVDEDMIVFNSPPGVIVLSGSNSNPASPVKKKVNQEFTEKG